MTPNEKWINDEIGKLDDANNISDGFHTFGELYEHRITLWIALCRVIESKNGDYEVSHNMREEVKVWRSKLHSDGSSFEGWFVLGIGEEKGKQITYHLPMSKWDNCSFAQTLDKAPAFDGHSSQDVLERIKNL